MASEVARRLRKSPTIAEARLWEELRRLRRQGYHFRRQEPIGRYIVDFACLKQRLIVEVDGIQHATAEGARADAARDANLTWHGYKVLRFTNADVTQDTGGVVLEILAALGAVVRTE
jgi:very-short-patch-repair endonuclease